jgi:hypothetical protein
MILRQILVTPDASEAGRQLAVFHGAVLTVLRGAEVAS